MISVKNAIVFAALGCVMGLMFGCASSTLVDKWRDPSYKAPSLGKILVIAVRKNEGKRRIWEDAFAGELAKQGVAATQSYTIFPDSFPDTTQVSATVQIKGFDAILAVLKLPTEKVRPFSSEERNINYSSYWQRYLTYYRDIDSPAYEDSGLVAIREIDVTTTGNNGRLIWTATSRTPDPGSVSDAQSGIAGLVVSDLAKQSIIRSKK
jgi:hypothetical protein